MCSLVGQQQPVQVRPGTRASSLYRSSKAIEDFHCNYGVNPAYEAQLQDGGLVVSGTGPNGEVRMIEIASHPFFVATLILPQTRSAADSVHPPIQGYAAAVRALC